MMKILLLCLTLTFSSAAECKYWGYYQEAETNHHITPKLLCSFAKVESRENPKAINRNTNGSFDVGVMQINSSWLPKLAKYGITLNDLFRPKTNIMVGAWILSQCHADFGESWKAIDCYNKGARRAKTHSTYNRLILEAYNTIQTPPSPPPLAQNPKEIENSLESSITILENGS